MLFKIASMERKITETIKGNLSDDIDSERDER